MGIKDILQTLAVFVVIVLVASGISSLLNKDRSSGNITGTVVADGDAQVVTLSANGVYYIVDPTTVKAGVPVQMVADLDNLFGCLRAVRIPQLGVSKNVKTGDNVIEFTPEKVGTYTITCSMGMGKGTLVVE
ncbi:MAG TPA: cupredoxin domain-containing protein [Candidatus Nanoarchaeia archaeon]|nr:cupredoxin domain-containing protein [Candidatus Nanoarchaeia archaeon]